MKGRENKGAGKRECRELFLDLAAGRLHFFFPLDSLHHTASLRILIFHPEKYPINPFIPSLLPLQLKLLHALWHTRDIRAFFGKYELAVDLELWS
jgi:hypothetical protein